VRRRVAADVAVGAVVVYLVRCELRRALRRAPGRKRDGLRAHAWLQDGVSVAVSRLVPGDTPVSVTVTAKGADGGYRSYIVRPGEDRVSVTTGRPQR
jgi:hypothetical protein